MRKLAVLFLLLVSTFAYAGDYHQDDQGTTVIYTITDGAGDPVSGQTPRIGVKRIYDGKWLDWNDSTYKTAASATTLFQSMTFDTTGGFYYRTFSVDNAVLVSSDYITIISNDDATYGDTQSENYTYDSLKDIIKINR